jgi:Ca2+-binding EF-hand superfamily protein
MYDIDNNGFLDKNDFDCLAVKNTIMEGKGSWDEAKYKKNKEVMKDLWDQIAEIADFDKDGHVTVNEFQSALQSCCMGKEYKDLPWAFRAFIETTFSSVDQDGDGSVGLEEYRYDCVSRMAYSSVDDLDSAFNKMLTDSDRKEGGITLARYKELYAQFLGNPDEGCSACYLFGPLPPIE